ncbi:ribosomal protein L32 [Verruconis gallopava]|uniref:Large ribosomal subunit protein bL32m n=1 Tax=Verruconis gallopava TaxID=253628 RepID=A0A0D1YWY3_9PEZI|nr:ribosomal protein L32 [Verruconis gallopava]KIW05237.1 ribosomal protein L32 [Verruconis gallopava]
MAARLLPLQPILHLFQPIQIAQGTLLRQPAVRRLFTPSSFASPLALPFAAFAGISDILREIWDGLLRAAPKKKTSHMKKRHRQMAGKALKDVTNLSRCSACGRLKRSHVLCTYCVEAVRTYVKEKVLGIPKYELQGPRREEKSTHNIAETAPGAWEMIKKRREQKARADAKEKKNDRTQW